MYKLRLPTTENLTMETIHSAFKITRDADAAYVPPGRLRRYDLIILDEISQIDETVWGKLKVALNELLPGPLVLFVGDEQQLQPVHGRPRLLLDLASLTEAGKARHVRLQQHEMARSVDPTMLTFLNKIRSKQPTRPELERFFRGRVWDSNIKDAVKKSYDIETTNHGKKFMFLTVTNKAAAALNQARLELEFPEEARRLSNGEGLPGEIANILLTADMRVRLTHNVNKEEGYVNGNTGQIRKSPSARCVHHGELATHVHFGVPNHSQRASVPPGRLWVRHHHAPSAGSHHGCDRPAVRSPNAGQRLRLCRHFAS